MTSPQRVSSTASSMARRAPSQPTTVRRGVPSGLGPTSAWISISSGREPSIPANTAAPDTPASRSARNRAEGLGTSTRPRSAISNTPISLAAPNRFLTARRIRN